MGFFDRLRNKRDTQEQGQYADQEFRFEVKDVFTITGHGTVVTGLVDKGAVMAGDTVTLHRLDGGRSKVIVKGIEKFRQGRVASASQGENVGIFLEGAAGYDVGVGDVLER